MKRYFFFSIVFAAALAVWSVPARRKPFVFRQPDGTEIVVTLVGDEYEHYYLTSEGDTLTPLYPPERGEGMSCMLVPKHAAPPQAVLEEKQRAIRGAELRAMRGEELRAMRGVQSFSNLLPPFGGKEGGRSPHQLVLLVEYPDCRFTYPAETLRRMLCEEGYSDDGATGSARDYFADQSRGLFCPEIEVVGPIMLPHPRAYYGTPTANMYDGQPWLMLTDAAPLVDEAVDFSRFDNDGDGFVDNVFLFYAGEGQNDSGPLESVWPHAANIWTYYALDCTLDGVRLGSYACTNEVTGAGRLTGIGTFCHEYSHVLGLPDLYSTLSASDCFSPGPFELMDSGSYNNEGRTPPNMSVYDRMVLGWLEPEDLTAPETVVLAPLHLSTSEGGSGDGASGYSTARRINTVKAEEYYLLENRQREGWDAYLPAHGMLVWHIDYDARAWGDNQVNVLPGHQRVDLIEADGVPTADSRDGDAFPGSRQTTAVNLTPWTGVPLDAAITEIREAPLQLPPFLLRQASPNVAERGGGLEGAEGAGAEETVAVTFKFRGGGERIEAPVALEADGVGPCGFTARWRGVPAVTDYEVVVWRGHEAVALDVTAEQPRTEGSSGLWTATVSGLEAATTYRYAVVAKDGERRSPQSNEVTLTTLPPTFDMLSPTDLAAVLTAEGWTLTWTALPEAAAYEVETFTLQMVAPDVVTLDFTGGIAALPAGWTTTSTQTSGVAGTYGAARPSLLLQPGEWLQSPVFASAINDYSLWSKGDVTATLVAEGRQLRVANAGGEGADEAPRRVAANTAGAPAYIDDVVVSYGGRAEHIDVVAYSTAPDGDAGKTGNAGNAGAAGATSGAAAAALTIPATGGQRWARVRGVNAEGVRSAWSAEVELPLLEGIVNVEADGTTPTAARYRIPPFVSISADGRKEVRK